MATVVAPASGFTVVTHGYPQHVQPAPLTPARIAPSVNCHTFQKGEPTALGMVQIMIGVVVLLFGDVTAFNAMTISTFSGIMFWGPIIYIVAGGLTVGASKSQNLCLVRASLVMNIFSMITAGIATIVHSIDIFIYLSHYDYPCSGSNNQYYAINCDSSQSRELGIAGVMLVLSVLGFMISICVLNFACKATCCTEQVKYMPFQDQGYYSIPMTHKNAASPNSQTPALPTTVEPPAYSKC